MLMVQSTLFMISTHHNLIMTNSINIYRIVCITTYGNRHIYSPDISKFDYRIHNSLWLSSVGLEDPDVICVAVMSDIKSGFSMVLFNCDDTDYFASCKMFTPEYRPTYDSAPLIAVFWNAKPMRGDLIC